MAVDAEITGVQELPLLTFRWPDGTEHSESGWDYHLTIAGHRHRVRTGSAGRTVHGRRGAHRPGAVIDGGAARVGVR